MNKSLKIQNKNHAGTVGSGNAGKVTYEQQSIDQETLVIIIRRIDESKSKKAAERTQEYFYSVGEWRNTRGPEQLIKEKNRYDF